MNNEMIHSGTGAGNEEIIIQKMGIDKAGGRPHRESRKKIRIYG